MKVKNNQKKGWEFVGIMGLMGIKLFRRINKLKLKIRNNIYSDAKNNKIRKK